MVDGYNPVPVQYRQSASAIASYSFKDIASNTGIITFYGANSTNETLHSLTTTSPYSETVLTVGTITSDTATKVIDLDFDVVMNTQRTLNGNLVASVPFGIAYKETSTDVGELYIIVKLRKWDGTSETEIANAQGKNLRSVGSNSPKTIDAITVAVTNSVIKSGETLRITIELWALKLAGTNGMEAMLGHDPQNRITCLWNTINGGDTRDYTFGADDPTALKFDVPFKLVDL